MAKKTNRKPIRASAKKKTSAKKTAPAKTADGRIPLKRICQELGLDPKASRVRLRRAWRRTNEKGKLEGNVKFHEKGSRWDLSAAEAKEVRAILSA